MADEGNKNALVISRDDSYGNGLSRAVERSLRLNHVDLLPAEKYDPRTTDFGPLVQRVASRRPGAIVLIGFDESIKILAGLRALDITPQNRKIYGTEGNMRETLPGQVAPPRQDVLEGMQGTTRRQIDRNFADRLNQSAGGGLVEFTYAAEVYDAVIVSALAAASAHSDSPVNIAEKIREVTEGGQKCRTYAGCIEGIKNNVDIDYDGISGPLEFNDSGEPCMVSYSVVEFNKYGRLDEKHTADASNLCVTLH